MLEVELTKRRAIPYSELRRLVLARQINVLAIDVQELVEKAEPLEAADLFDPEEFSKHLDMPVFLDRTRRLKLSQPSGSVPAALGRETR